MLFSFFIYFNRYTFNSYNFNLCVFAAIYSEFLLIL